MGSTPQHPNWAALYDAHREVMYRTAWATLSSAGLVDEALDVVNQAMLSVMEKPPPDMPDNWEAFLVVVTRRRALDLVRSAWVQHHGGELTTDMEHDLDRAQEDVADFAVERVDSLRRAATAWDNLSILTSGERHAVWEFIALEKSRAEVAAALGATPARVSQLTKRALEKLKDDLTAEKGGPDDF